MPLYRPDVNRIANTGVGLKRPIHAACRGIERIDSARIDANENAASRNCRLAISLFNAGKSESPFQFQLRHLRGGKTCGLGGLKTCVGRRVVSPAVPGRFCGNIAERRIARALVLHQLRIGDLGDAGFPATQTQADFEFVTFGEALQVRVRPLAQRIVYFVARQTVQLQLVGPLYCAAGITMAFHTVLFKRANTLRGLRKGRIFPGHKNCRNNCQND